MDNIRDAALKDSRTPVARRGWTALSQRADADGVLVNDYGTTCLRLKGNRLLIDRTAGFSEDEFHRIHREYAKLGLRDIWIVNVTDDSSKELRERLPENFMTMIHPDSKRSYFLIDGRKYTLAGGVTYIMTGDTSSTHLIGVDASEQVHRGSYPRITLSGQQKQPV